MTDSATLKAKVLSELLGRYKAAETALEIGETDVVLTLVDKDVRSAALQFLKAFPPQELPQPNEISGTLSSLANKLPFPSQQKSYS